MCLRSRGFNLAILLLHFFSFRFFGFKISYEFYTQGGACLVFLCYIAKCPRKTQVLLRKNAGFKKIAIYGVLLFSAEKSKFSSILRRNLFAGVGRITKSMYAV